MHGSRFGYALANGTVGVYDRTARYWRIKVPQSHHHYNLRKQYEYTFLITVQNSVIWWVCVLYFFH